MNLKTLKEQLNAIDTFGLDDALVEVEFRTDMGGALEFKDINLNVSVSPKLKSTLVIGVKSKPVHTGWR